MRVPYYNREHYDVVPASDMPSNVFACIDKDWQQRSGEKPREGGLIVCRMLYSLVKQFAEQRPDWQFYSRYHTYAHDALDCFYVYKGKELLGELSTSGGGRKYYITSPLIKEKLERGSGRETRSYDKALYWLRTLQPKTLDAKMHEHTAVIENAIRRFRNDQKGELDYKLRNMMSYLRSYVYDNWGAMSEIATKAGMDKSVAEAIEETRDKLEVVRNIAGDNDLENGVAVYLQDNMYLVGNPKDCVNKFTTYSNGDTLPDNIRRNLGILKLAADESFVRDVGYRHDSTRFFVVTREPHDDSN